MSTEEKEARQFVWFASFTNAIEQLPNKTDKALMALAIYQYGALGIEPTFIATKTCPEFVFRSIFEATRINIDNSVKNYENGKKGKEAGSKGGRPRKGETKEEAYARRNNGSGLDVDISNAYTDENRFACDDYLYEAGEDTLPF